MSRSRKKAIYKDGAGPWKRCLRRLVKRSQRNFLRSNLSEIIAGNKAIPDDKTIVNDYTYSDYTYNLEYRKRAINNRNISEERFKEIKEQLSRK